MDSLLTTREIDVHRSAYSVCESRMASYWQVTKTWLAQLAVPSRTYWPVEVSEVRAVPEWYPGVTGKLVLK